MKELLIKDHYHYRIHTLLMKSSAYLSLLRINFLYRLSLDPLIHLYNKILNFPSSIIFQKFKHLPINTGGGHYVITFVFF